MTKNSVLKKLILLILMVFGAIDTHAVSVRYDVNRDLHKYAADFGVVGVGQSFYEDDATYPQVFGGIAKMQRDFMIKVKSTIQSELLKLMSDSGIPGYSNGNVYVSGPITFEIKNGEVAFSGLQVSMAFDTSASRNGISGSCRIGIALNPSAKIVGKLDLKTGVYTTIRIENFSLIPSQSCSTNLSWIPGVGQFIDDLANNAVSKILAEKIRNIYDLVAKGIGSPIVLTNFGIDTITSGKLIIQGRDFGAEIKNGLKNFLASGYASITIGDPRYMIYGDRVGFSPRGRSLDLIMSFVINNYTFRLYEWTSYADMVYCPKVGQACMLP